MLKAMPGTTAEFLGMFAELITYLTVKQTSELQAILLPQRTECEMNEERL